MKLLWEGMAEELLTIGKPEPLKENLSGMWSDILTILTEFSCKGHYDD